METITVKIPEEERIRLRELFENNMLKNLKEDLRYNGATIKVISFGIAMSAKILIETDAESEMIQVVVN